MGVFITLLLSLIFFHVDGELGITQHLRRLISSNCVMIERGGMPPYRKCGMTQCIIQNAIACISDMRHNRSGNIAPDCQIGSLYNRRQNYGKDVVVDYNPSRDPPYEFGTKDPNTGEFVADPRLGIKELTIDPCCPEFPNVGRPSKKNKAGNPLEDDPNHNYDHYVWIPKPKPMYSAYPEAFTCLKNAGCEETQYWDDLMRECEWTCPGQYYPLKDNRNTWNDRRNIGFKNNYDAPVCDVYWSAAPSRYGASLLTSSLIVGTTALALAFL